MAWGVAATSPEVLARLVATGRGESEAAPLRAALAEGRRVLASDAGGPFAPLAAACTVLGLRAVSARLPLRQAVESAGAGQPVLVTLAADGAVLALVTDCVGARVRVERLPEGDAAWMGLGALAAAAGADGEAGLVDVVLLETAAPLGGPSPAASPHSASEGTDTHGPTPQRRLLAWMMGERADLLTLLVYALFVGLLGIVTPVAVQSLVTTVTFGTLTQPLVVLAVLVLGALAFAATLRALSFWVVEVIRRRFFARVCAALASRLGRVDRSALGAAGGRELANRFFDVFTAQKAAVSLLVDGVDVVLTVVVGMLVLGFYHPLLLALDVVLVVFVALVVLFLGREGPRTAIAASHKKYETAAFFQQLADGAAAHRLGAGPDLVARDAEVHAREWLAARAAHFGVVLNQTASMLALQAIATAALVGVGGFLVIGRQLTLGQLVAAELIVTTVVGALAKVGKHLEGYYELLASLDKVGHLLDVALEPEGALHALPGPLSVALEGVRTLAQQKVTLHVGEAEKVVVLLESPEERARVADLLTTLGRPERGRVALGALDRRELDLDAIRRRIALVREGDLVRGSVLENVRMGRPASVELVRARLARVGLLSLVDALPEGLDTSLGTSEVALTAAQSARLAVARASVAGADLVVVDGAFDALPASDAASLAETLVECAGTLVVLTSAGLEHPSLAPRAVLRGDAS